ncbi:MAG TPA: 3-phosphoshikimate 1-carboxyvinyltransferase [Actinomycetota bacterium]|nr:3-phosphoshikimate 1-carboxyvinyltransferase [Actinomycetota bacterium]
MKRQIVISPSRRVEGSIRVPGDKSISHRALLVGAMGEGEMEIEGLSPAVDVASSRVAIGSLGVQTLDLNVRVESVEPSTSSTDSQILLDGRGMGSWRAPEGVINVGNSGTTIRLLLGQLAGSPVSTTVTGDGSIRGRPMKRVVAPLREMGASISGEDDGDHAPLVVAGGRLHGVAHTLPIASAQVKSALLLAGLLAQGETSVEEPAPSRDHTERLLEYLGVPIARSGKRLIVKSTNVQNAKVTVPGDLSSAAFFLVAAALLPDSAVEITGVGVNPTRTGVLDVLRMFGARVEVGDVIEESGEPRGTVRVSHGDRRSLDLAGEMVVTALDELPLVAVLATAAEGETVVRDAAELRVKESDRVATIVNGLSRMGAEISSRPDGFVVRGPTPLRGAEVDAAGDHRIAMALAVAALTADGPTAISGWDSVAVSYPGFEQDLGRLVVP